MAAADVTKAGESARSQEEKWAIVHRKDPTMRLWSLGWGWAKWTRCKTRVGNRQIFPQRVRRNPFRTRKFWFGCDYKKLDEFRGFWHTLHWSKTINWSTFFSAMIGDGKKKVNFFYKLPKIILKTNLGSVSWIATDWNNRRVSRDVAHCQFLARCTRRSVRRSVRSSRGQRTGNCSKISHSRECFWSVNISDDSCQ